MYVTAVKQATCMQHEVPFSALDLPGAKLSVTSPILVLSTLLSRQSIRCWNWHWTWFLREPVKIHTKLLHMKKHRYITIIMHKTFLSQ